MPSIQDRRMLTSKPTGDKPLYVFAHALLCHDLVHSILSEMSLYIASYVRTLPTVFGHNVRRLCAVNLVEVRRLLYKNFRDHEGRGMDYLLYSQKGL